MRSPHARSLAALVLLVVVLGPAGCTDNGAAADAGAGGADLAVSPPPDLAHQGDGGGGGGGGDGGHGKADMTTPVACPDNPFSSFADVAIRFTGNRCRFTLAEAAAGIEIPYEVVVAKDVPGVIPEPLDGGKCGRPGPSGLILFEKLSGGGQTYCICDEGLCMPPAGTPVSITGGVYPGKFVWSGKNWMGPSDTNNPQGAPFPAGTYDLIVQSVGKYQSGMSTFSFAVRNTLQITLVP